MARLSVEHYRANANMTPEHVRRSSRFRDLFKTRSSVSPSVVKESTSSPPGSSPPVPPPTPISPTIKPGFEKVGLLPSERTSLEDAKEKLSDNGGAHIVDALEAQDAWPKRVGTPNSLDMVISKASEDYMPTLGKTSLDHQHVRADFAPVEGNTAIEKGQDSMRPASASKMSPYQPQPQQIKDYKLDEFPFFKIGNKEPSQRDESQPIKNNELQTKYKVHIPVGYTTPSCKTINDNTQVNKRDHPSKPESTVSDIVEDEDSRSHGVREYVVSKIAEALVEHERNILRKVETMGAKSRSVKLHIVMPDNKDFSGSGLVQVMAERSKFFGGPRTLGACTIHNPDLASALQLVSICFWASIATKGLFGGPTALTLAFLMSLIFTKVYTFTKSHLGWETSHPDLLTIPVDYTKELAQKKLYEGMHAMAKMLILAIGDAANDLKVDVKID